jgi:hypothetical protein
VLPESGLVNAELRRAPERLWMAFHRRGLSPSLVVSDPHRDPHGTGRGRSPLDGSASIARASEFGMDPHGRPWTALARTGNAVSGVTRIEGSNPSRSAKNPCTVRLLGPRELRPCAAIGRITAPNLTPR